ncbi:hypothetical protein PIROE2DRAFT_18603 [Piromyces sp. E2]|nr:hypothetical protein PIROE2DRAFT_18603 [Piromyces sp. E2]|eukprot:OUM56677.1 hypothetical protein PIROE2DRAFT_18603 [Piromyces sp. E2]
MYISKLSPHFLDLNEYLPKEHINYYNPNVIEACTYDNKLVGLPIIIVFSVFYSNSELLNKYNKTIPVTWNEFLETSKYIMEKERKANNTNLMIYNGLFNGI